MYPIYIFGTGGAGVSLVIWMIKKMVNPSYPIDNPISPEYNAHSQPLLPHWGFDNKTAEEILQGCPEQEQILHCEPNINTWGKTPTKSTIVIRADSKEELQKIAVLRKHKIDIYQNEKVQSLYESLLDNLYVTMTIPGAFNITFSQLASYDIENLLTDLCKFLGIKDLSAMPDVIAIHKIWQEGNDLLLNNYMSEFNLGEVPND
jgi:hypothetical protein